jgi:hypothetical protein
MDIPFRARLTEVSLREIRGAMFRPMLRRVLVLLGAFFLLTQVSGGYTLLLEDPLGYVVTWFPLPLYFVLMSLYVRYTTWRIP